MRRGSYLFSKRGGEKRYRISRGCIKGIRDGILALNRRGIKESGNGWGLPSRGKQKNHKKREIFSLV